MQFSNKEESTTITSHEGLGQCALAPLAGAVGNMPELKFQSTEERLGVVFKDNSSTSVSQTVSFHDITPSTGYLYEGDTDATFALQDSGNDSLSEFFSRPVKIQEWSMPINAWAIVKFNPWELFFQNVRNVNRISNYKLLRCTLHVKFLVNGNGFYYGRAMASYLPYANQDYLETGTGAGDQYMQVIRSQRPHVFLDPTMSQGGELTLPFFCQRNNMSIPEADWSQMGEITLESLTRLRHGNGGTKNVPISVFAYATDVRLSVPTTAEPASLSPQSCEEDVVLVHQADETDIATGRISGPASAVAASLSMLSKAMPSIGPYAMAGSMVASTISGVSRLFGWSRPKTAATVSEKVTIEACGNLANVDVADNSVSLALDSKNEVTIDPRVVGLPPIDELSLSTIAAHETLFYQAEWDQDDLPERSLVQVRVDPYLPRKPTVGEDAGANYFPATAYAALPFGYWTGTLNFRFQILCSAFHRGRLKIVYDPQYFKSDEYNVNYMKIIDISETRDFTVSIPPCQSRQFMKRLTDENVTSQMYLNNGSNLGSLPQGNGIIGLFVVNPLMGPSVTAPAVDILVSISAGPDFQCADPSDDISFLTLHPQSIEEDLIFQALEEDVSVDDAAAPVGDPTSMTGLQASISDNLGKVFFGETVVSLRPLLKRFHHFMRTQPQVYGVVSRRFFRMQMSAFPFNRGNVTPTVTGVVGGVGYNYVNTTMLNYLAFAFVGWRGSIRWKFIVDDQGPSKTTLSVSRNQYGGQYVRDEFALPATSGMSIADVGSVAAADGLTAAFTGATGTHVANASVQPTAEIEMPFYTHERFLLCRKEDRTSVSYAEEDDADGIDISTTISRSYDIPVIDCYVAGGDDFSVHFYVGPPPLYFDWSPPAVV